jgi:hypothetical protein
MLLTNASAKRRFKLQPLVGIQNSAATTALCRNHLSSERRVGLTQKTRITHKVLLLADSSDSDADVMTA